MILLIRLILAHLIGDFVLQPKSWVKEKEDKKAKSVKLYIHALVHGVLAIVLTGNIIYWPLALAVAVLHLFIDVLKMYCQKEGSKAKWFLIDQGLHIVSLVLLLLIWFRPQINFSDISLSPSTWIYITAILIITSVSGIVIQILLSKWSKSITDNDDDSLASAGKYIGILERLFVFTFILIGQWEGIGFLLAAKSVFRFGDLKESKDRKLTEYILIGTLLSFGIAMGVGLATIKLVNILE